MEELLALIALEDKRVTIKDARACFKGCIPGWRTFSEAHGFDWPTVVRNGLLASELIATDDAMATKIVSYVYGVTYE